MKQFVILFSFLFVIFYANTTFAANLNLSPSSGSYKVGDTINVRIVLSSADQSANAVSGTLSFSKDFLTLNSISKSNSLISLWAQEPTYSNANGTANMEGVILNGYTGSNGTIVTLSFKAKAVGSANVKFSSSSVLANDGQGTSILANTGQANFTITKAVDKPAPAVIKEISKPKEEPITPVTKVMIPVFNDYSKDLNEGEFIIIKGSADPATNVIINFDAVFSSTDEGVHDSTIVKSNDKGEFVYVSERTKNGIYMITAQARNQDSVFSEKTSPIKISVTSAQLPQSSFPSTIINSFSVIIPIIGLIILLILMMIWGWHHILHYRELMNKKLLDSRAIVSKSFNILDEDVKEEVKIFKKIKASQLLTNDERLFINQFKKDIEEAEQAILSKMK